MVPLRRYWPLAGIVAAAAVTLAVLATRVRDWIVMTDELQYAKLATAFAQGELLPALRGQHVSSYAQVYPALLSPLYGELSTTSALAGAHILNALLFAVAAVPAFLLARSEGVPRLWAFVVAGAAVVLPWNVLTAFVLTESAAYAIFLWTVLALQRAVSAPSPRWDAIALAALTVAFFTRTQFVVLALVFPLAALAHEGPRRALRRHVLVEAYAIALIAAVVLAATGGVDRVVGRYSVTVTEGSILPWRAIEQAGAHLDVVAVGIGLLPLLLGGAWLVVAAWRRNAFALLGLFTVVLLTLETSSYDVRFGNVLRDRYLFYLAPLLLVAAAAALRDGVRPAALAGVTLFVAVTVFAHDFVPRPGLYVDSPVSVLNGLIDASVGAAFVALAAVVLALVSVRLPSRFRATATAAFVVFASGATATTAWTRLLTSHGPSGRPVTGKPGEVLDWADRVLPDDAKVGMIAYSTAPTWALSAIFWWDVEFWNRTVDRAYVVGNTWEYAPFPHEQLEIDPQTGAVHTQSIRQFAIVATSDARFRLAGPRVAQNLGVEILQPEQPWRVEWLSMGLDADGWTRAGRTASFRVFPKPGLGVERVRVTVHLSAPRGQPLAYRFAGKDRALDAGGARTEQADVCVAPPGYAPLELSPTRTARIVGLPIGPLVTTTREVGPHVTSVAVLHTAQPC